MNKEFTYNVQHLYRQVVTNTDADGNACDLLNALLCKVTLPLRHYWEDEHLHLVYYNVSLDIASDLSSFEVSYTTDFIVTLTDLQHSDIYQLAEFILALERDIPQWRHIWIAAEELQKKKTKMAEHLKFALSEIHHEWMFSDSYDLTSNTNYRLRFYNIKAAHLMLEHDNPFWNNKKTEAEILDECNLYHVDAPFEQWFDDWTQFAHNCENQKTERDRKRQEHQDKLMKMRHLINIKQLKLEALLKTIEYHPSVTVKVYNNFDLNRIESTRFGKYFVTLSIDSACTLFKISYNQLDLCTQKITEYINRVNDVASELRCALIEDGSLYYVSSKGQSFMGIIDESPFFIAEYSGDSNRHVKCDHLSSSRVINRINALCHEIRVHINNCEE